MISYSTLHQLGSQYQIFENFLVCMYIFERHTELPSTGPLPKCPPQLGLGQARGEPGTQSRVPYLEAGTQSLFHHLLSPSLHSKKLESSMEPGSTPITVYVPPPQAPICSSILSVSILIWCPRLCS